MELVENPRPQGPSLFPLFRTLCTPGAKPTYWSDSAVLSSCVGWAQNVVLLCKDDSVGIMHVSPGDHVGFSRALVGGKGVRVGVLHGCFLLNLGVDFGSSGHLAWIWQGKLVQKPVNSPIIYGLGGVRGDPLAWPRKQGHVLCARARLPHCRPQGVEGRCGGS